jgi:hypothetical protein
MTEQIALLTADLESAYATSTLDAAACSIEGCERREPPSPPSPPLPLVPPARGGYDPAGVVAAPGRRRRCSSVLVVLAWAAVVPKAA